MAATGAAAGASGGSIISLIKSLTWQLEKRLTQFQMIKLYTVAILLVRKLSGQGRPCFVMAPNRELAHEENRRVVITLQLYLQLQ